MASSRAMKRTRADARVENFWDSDPSDTGTYLHIRLTSGKALKGRGWPYVQQCIRGILGDQKVQKANFQSDGSLLVKTCNDRQTEKLLQATMFGADECNITRDSRLNSSRGTIYAYDLIELNEDEVVGWLREFGVTAAKRFTRRVDGCTVNTPTLLLTFNRPTCPNKLELDYITYHVRRHIPNPLICHKCGKFGHAEARCSAEAVCLNCAGERHEGPCQAKCVNCEKSGHSCRSRDCPVWKKEREICELKVDRDVSYAHARRLYDQTHQTPVIRPYATVVRSQSDTNNQDNVLRDRVEKLEQKVDRMITLLSELLDRQSSHAHKSGLDSHSGDFAPPTVPVVPPGNAPGPSHTSTVMPVSEGVMDVTELPISGVSESQGTQNSADPHMTVSQCPQSTSRETVGGGGGQGHGSRPRSNKPADHDSSSSPHIGERKSKFGVGKSGKPRMPSLTRGAYTSE